MYIKDSYLRLESRATTVFPIDARSFRISMGIVGLVLGIIIWWLSMWLTGYPFWSLLSIPIVMSISVITWETVGRRHNKKQIAQTVAAERALTTPSGKTHQNIEEDDDTLVMTPVASEAADKETNESLVTQIKGEVQITIHPPETKPAKLHSRTLVKDPQTCTECLVIETWERVGRRGFVEKRSWRHIVHVQDIKDSGLIDRTILTRPGFMPIEGESAIYAFMRLSWWSHGPKQILVTLFAIAAMIATALLLPASGIIVFGSIVAELLVAAGVFLAVWIPWAYMYIIVTNERIMLVYDPPFVIPGFSRDVALVKLQGIDFDESLIGKALGFARIYSETAASELDKWLKDGIKYVTHYKGLTNLLSSFIVKQSK